MIGFMQNKAVLISSLIVFSERHHCVGEGV